VLGQILIHGTSPVQLQAKKAFSMFEYEIRYIEISNSSIKEKLRLLYLKKINRHAEERFTQCLEEQQKIPKKKGKKKYLLQCHPTYPTATHMSDKGPFP